MFIAIGPINFLQLKPNGCVYKTLFHRIHGTTNLIEHEWRQLDLIQYVEAKEKNKNKNGMTTTRTTKQNKI